MTNCGTDLDREVNRVIDQILREDRLESVGLNGCPDPCATTSEVGTTIERSRSPLWRINEKVQFREGLQGSGSKCAVETCARFSIRVLEAIRGVQRQKTGDTWSSCTTKEVVKYIQKNYHHDGDLLSQVETALKQVTLQGFVLKLRRNEYRLVGPYACVLEPSALVNDRRPRCTLARRPSSVLSSLNSRADFLDPTSIERPVSIHSPEDGEPIDEDEEMRRPELEEPHDQTLEEFGNPVANSPRRRNGGGVIRGGIPPRCEDGSSEDNAFRQMIVTSDDSSSDRREIPERRCPSRNRKRCRSRNRKKSGSRKKKKRRGCGGNRCGSIGNRSRGRGTNFSSDADISDANSDDAMERRPCVRLGDIQKRISCRF